MHFFLAVGEYARHLQHWIRKFGRDRFVVETAETFASAPWTLANRARDLRSSWDLFLAGP